MKKLFKISIAFSVLVIFQTTLKAQEFLSPENALTIALKNNFDILLAKKEIQIATNANTIGNAGLLPELELVGGYAGSNRDLRQTFVSGNVVNQNNVGTEEFNYALNFGWTLFDGMGMFARKKLLQGEQELKEWELKSKVQNLVENLWIAYYGIVADQVLLNSMLELEKLVEERLKIAKIRFESGLGAKTDLLLAQIDFNTVKTEIKELKNRLKNTKVDLLTIMAEENQNKDFIVIDSITVNANLLKNFDDKAKFNNPNLMAYRRQVENARLSYQESKSYFYPQIRLTGSYTGIRAESEAGFLLQNQNRGLNYGITARIPIYYGGQGRIGLQNSLLRSEMAQVEFNLALWDLQRTELQAKNNLLNYVELAKIEQENIEIAKEFMALSLQRFETGKATILEVKESQKIFSDIVYRYTRNLYFAKLAEIQLLKVKGELVK